MKEAACILLFAALPLFAQEVWPVPEWTVDAPESQGLKAEWEEAGLEVEAFLGDLAGDPLDPDSNDFGVIARKGW